MKPWNALSIPEQDRVINECEAAILRAFGRFPFYPTPRERAAMMPTTGPQGPSRAPRKGRRVSAPSRDTAKRLRARKPAPGQVLHNKGAPPDD